MFRYHLLDLSTVNLAAQLLYVPWHMAAAAHASSFQPFVFVPTVSRLYRFCNGL